MWTRGALYSVLSRNAARYSLVDLNHIYELNEQLGYNGLDRRVKVGFFGAFSSWLHCSALVFKR